MQSNEPDLVLLLFIVVVFVAILFGLMWLLEKIQEKRNKGGVLKRMDEIAGILVAWGFQEYVEDQPHYKKGEEGRKTDAHLFRWFEVNRTGEKDPEKISISCNMSGNLLEREVKITFVTPTLLDEREWPAVGVIEFKERKIGKRQPFTVMTEDTLDTVFHKFSNLTEHLKAEKRLEEKREKVYHRIVNAPLHRSLNDILDGRDHEAVLDAFWIVLFVSGYICSAFYIEALAQIFVPAGVLGSFLLLATIYSRTNISADFLKKLHPLKMMGISLLAFVLGMFAWFSDPHLTQKLNRYIFIGAMFFAAFAHYGLQNWIHSLIWRKRN